LAGDEGLFQEKPLQLFGKFFSNLSNLVETRHILESLAAHRWFFGRSGADKKGWFWVV